MRYQFEPALAWASGVVGAVDRLRNVLRDFFKISFHWACLNAPRKSAAIWQKFVQKSAAIDSAKLAPL
jgi:hypothetical protein